MSNDEHVDITVSAGPGQVIVDVMADGEVEGQYVLPTNVALALARHIESMAVESKNLLSQVSAASSGVTPLLSGPDIVTDTTIVRSLPDSLLGEQM